MMSADPVGQTIVLRGLPTQRLLSTLLLIKYGFKEHRAARQRASYTEYLKELAKAAGVENLTREQMARLDQK